MQVGRWRNTDIYGCRSQMTDLIGRWAGTGRGQSHLKSMHLDLTKTSMPRCISREPALDILSHKIVVAGMRITCAHPVDFLHLARRQVFARIQTPATFKKSLAPQDFVQTGDASGKTVSSVEKGGVGVRHFSRTRKQVGGKVRVVTALPHFLQQFDGPPGPYGPVP